ncbi:MAG: hypothetical protein Q9160_004864 [Pyrenula sp. 1 TL-2023]
MDPEVNPFYKTTPQKYSNDLVIDYDRGKGLGGSTVVNFENFHDEDIPEKFRKYVNPKAQDHGKEGLLHIGFTEDYNDATLYYVDLFEKSGYKLNPDFNDGDPIGLGLPAGSFHRGWRTTAHDQFQGAPDNLTILANSLVNRVIFENKIAIGVESNGKQYFASKEVILSAGSLDTPKILMHSGIGDSAHLSEFSIPVVHHLPQVGQGLCDHNHVGLLYQRQEHTTTTPAFWRDSASRLPEAQKQWEKDRTGPLSTLGSTYGLGFFKLDGLEDTQEFKALPEHRQKHLMQPTVPHYEFCVNTPFPADPLNPVAVCFIMLFFMNLESRGSVTLQSPSFSQPCLYDPQVLSHPYDRMLVIRAMRSLLKTVHSSPFSDDTIKALAEPEGGVDATDEAILEWVKGNLGSTWHMTGTVKAGPRAEAEAGEEDGDGSCVDNGFRVRGVKGLRVVDMSVYPIIPNNHTQSSAYLVGALGAEKLAREYGL